MSATDPILPLSIHRFDADPPLHFFNSQKLEISYILHSNYHTKICQMSNEKIFNAFQKTYPIHQSKN